MERVIRRFSIAFKQSVVAEVTSGQYTVSEASRIHDVRFQVIYRWLKRYGGPASQTRIMRIEMPDEPNRVLKLEKEKQALEKALAQAQLKIMTLEATLEVLQERTVGLGRDRIVVLLENFVSLNQLGGAIGCGHANLWGRSRGQIIRKQRAIAR